MKTHICKKCGGIAGWDPYFQSWICTRCGNNEPKPITNYDRIISKTPEKLAMFLSDVVDCGVCEEMHGFRMCDAAQDKACEDCWAGWLRQEAEEGK